MFGNFQRCSTHTFVIYNDVIFMNLGTTFTNALTYRSMQVTLHIYIHTLHDISF